MKIDKSLFTIEHFDIMDSGSQEIKVKCSKCGKRSRFPFATLIRRENGESCATYREFCSNSCFIDWIVWMAPKLKELKDSFPAGNINIPDQKDSEDENELPPNEEFIESD